MSRVLSRVGCSGMFDYKISNDLTRRAERKQTLTIIPIVQLPDV